MVTFAAVMSAHAGSQSDRELTELMIGAWRSPRHDYVFRADGTWWMGKPDPEATHGSWRIEHHRLVQTVYGPHLEQLLPLSDDPINKLTREEIIFADKYKMKRIPLSEVDKPR
jgi:hypothetical protein